MKRVCSIFLFAALLGPFAQGHPCGSVYFEAVHLKIADTFAGLLYPKAGYCWEELGLETYAAVRAGGDSRTHLDRGDAIFNDNFLFTGAEVDYLGLLRGVRLPAQAGPPFDLNRKIHKAGFDYRAGEQSYHKIEWPLAFHVTTEIYTEALYVRRYRNLMSAAQFRNVHRTFEWDAAGGRFELGPFLTGVASIDSKRFDYNRFLEGHLGGRVRYFGPLALQLSAYYVRGARWERPTTLPDYEDFRVLLSGYWAF